MTLSDEQLRELCGSTYHGPRSAHCRCDMIAAAVAEAYRAGQEEAAERAAGICETAGDAYADCNLDSSAACYECAVAIAEFPIDGECKGQEKPSVPPRGDRRT